MYHNISKYFHCHKYFWILTIFYWAFLNSQPETTGWVSYWNSSTTPFLWKHLQRNKDVYKKILFFDLFRTKNLPKNCSISPILLLQSDVMPPCRVCIIHLSHWCSFHYTRCMLSPVLFQNWVREIKTTKDMFISLFLFKRNTDSGSDWIEEWRLEF